MTWFGASIILYLRLAKGPQSRFAAKERIFLLRARNATDARRKAQALGRKCFKGSFRVSKRGQEAHLEFIGVRRVDQVLGPRSLKIGVAPSHGVEITSSRFEVRSRSHLKAFLRGAPVMVDYLDQESWA